MSYPLEFNVRALMISDLIPLINDSLLNPNPVAVVDVEVVDIVFDVVTEVLAR